MTPTEWEDMQVLYCHVLVKVYCIGYREDGLYDYLFDAVDDAPELRNCTHVGSVRGGNNARQQYGVSLLCFTT
jgi:hypothetical protein